jgi:hypothetical protein
MKTRVLGKMDYKHLKLGYSGSDCIGMDIGPETLYCADSRNYKN